MIILVKSDDKRTLELLERFASESNKEYEKMRKGIKLRVLSLTGRIPEALGCIAYEVEGGYAIDLPFSIPEIEYIQSVISRHLKMEIGGKWKDKMVKNVRGYLDGNGVSYSFVGVVDEKDVKKKTGGD